MLKKIDDSSAERGARIVIDQWIQLKAGEHLCIVTSQMHQAEAELLKKIADKRSDSCLDHAGISGRDPCWRLV
jgi:hypothetical protein